MLNEQFNFVSRHIRMGLLVMGEKARRQEAAYRLYVHV